jgi:hypothetical protein
MKVRQLRAALEEYAAIHKSKDAARALQALSRALETADGKEVADIVPLLRRAAAVA